MPPKSGCPQGESGKLWTATIIRPPGEGVNKDRMPATLSVFRDRCWQVAASNRQAEVAQKTLDFLLKEREQQRQIDVSAVRGWRDGYRMGAVFERKKESSDKGSELWVTG